MQLGRIFAMIVAGSAVALRPHLTCGAQRTPVEVWRVGDDGLTLKFSDRLETGFKTSTTFLLSSGKRSGTLIVTIPSNLDWKQIGKRTQIRYSVEFSSIHGEKLGSNTGYCWEDSLQNCVAQIVKAADVAAKKLSTHVRGKESQH